MKNILSLAQQLIRIPSVSHDTEQLHVCIDRIRKEFTVYPGSIIEKKIYKGKPSLLVANFEGKWADIVLNGHIDVVDVVDKKQFEPYSESGRLYGRGSGDMKTAIALMIELMKESLETKKTKKKILLMITSDEEVGGFDGVNMLTQEGRGGDIVLIPDGGSTNAIDYVEKGIYMFEAESFGKSCHSARPWQGKNAIHNIVNFFSDIRSQLQETQKVYFSDDHRGTSVNFNMIQAGDAINKVPAYARAKFDIRFTEEFSLKKVKEVVLSTMPSYDCSLVSEISSDVHCENINHPLFKKYMHYAQSVLGKKPKLTKAHGGSDGRFFARTGKSVVILHRPDCGNLHGKDERIDIEGIEKVYQCYRKIIFD